MAPTKEQCSSLLKTKNPLTGRSILINGPTYKKLNKACSINHKYILVVEEGVNIARNRLQIDVIITYNKAKYNNLINKIHEQTQKLLDKNVYVSLIGYSHGGFIVSRVAEIMASKYSDKSKLAITTFGSTYIPKFGDVRGLNGVNIMHYMYRDDIALGENKLDFKIDQRSDVRWLRREESKNNYDMKTILKRDRMNPAT